MCLSVRDYVKSSQKEQKGFGKKKGKVGLLCLAPDSPVPPTGQSGTRSDRKDRSREKEDFVGYNSLDSPCGAADSPVCQPNND
jgi:hypothetical protein